MLRHLISNLLGFVGAVVGGVAGILHVPLALETRFLRSDDPRCLPGLGCSLLARHPSNGRGSCAAWPLLGLGLFTEWRFRPFDADDSFQYFLTHVKDLSLVPTLLMIGIGALIAFWVGKDAGFRGYIGAEPAAGADERLQERPQTAGLFGARSLASFRRG